MRFMQPLSSFWAEAQFNRTARKITWNKDLKCDPAMNSIRRLIPKDIVKLKVVIKNATCDLLNRKAKDPNSKQAFEDALIQFETKFNIKKASYQEQQKRKNEQLQKCTVQENNNSEKDSEVTKHFQIITQASHSKMNQPSKEGVNTLFSQITNQPQIFKPSEAEIEELLFSITHADEVVAEELDKLIAHQVQIAKQKETHIGNELSFNTETEYMEGYAAENDKTAAEEIKTPEPSSSKETLTNDNEEIRFVDPLEKFRQSLNQTQSKYLLKFLEEKRLAETSRQDKQTISQKDNKHSHPK